MNEIFDQPSVISLVIYAALYDRLVLPVVTAFSNENIIHMLVLLEVVLNSIFLARPNKGTQFPGLAPARQARAGPMRLAARPHTRNPANDTFSGFGDFVEAFGAPDWRGTAA